eukprot:s1156_g8.t1
MLNRAIPAICVTAHQGQAPDRSPDLQFSLSIVCCMDGGYLNLQIDVIAIQCPHSCCRNDEQQLSLEAGQLNHHQPMTGRAWQMLFIRTSGIGECLNMSSQLRL